MVGTRLWRGCVTTSPKTLKVIDRGTIEGHDRRQGWEALVRKVVQGAHPA